MRTTSARLVAGASLVFVVAAAIVTSTSCGCVSRTPPTVRGSAVVGQRLSASGGASRRSDHPSAVRGRDDRYTWLRCDSAGRHCSVIAGPHGDTYALRSSDYGHTIRARVSASAGGSTSDASAPTPVVGSETTYGGMGYGTGDWPSGAWVPYSSDSPWNQQLPPPALTPRAPDSADVIQYMTTRWPSQFAPEEISNAPSQDAPSLWDHPLYWATRSDPRYTIDDTWYPCRSPTSTACPRTVRIPNGAYHALASDGHLAVVQPDGRTEVDFWQVQNRNPISGGGTLIVHGYGALQIDGSGCCSGATAAHQGLEAGQIRAQELQAGAIHHALSVSVPCTSRAYIYPALGLAGPCPAAAAGAAPANGQRLQLDMTESRIARMAVSTPVKLILDAMLHYGLIVTDTGGSAVALQWEPALDYVSFGYSNPAMIYLASQGFSDPARIAITLPWTDFQVVNVCYTKGTC
jgi:hypothetical protein